ncbi:MAG: antibiotic resistance protein VanZ [Sphaerochaeta sp.]|nr:antibiotic resistance protein VanZ [Sphaerochaeta sp.]
MRDRLPLQTILRIVGSALTVLVVLAIIYFSLMPKESYPNVTWIPFADKGDHMAAYAGLGFSLFIATLQIPGSGKTRKNGKNSHSTLHLTSWAGPSILMTLSIGLLFGFAVEMIQPLFGRSREWMDLAADFMGLVVGLAIALVLLNLAGNYFVTRPWLYDPNWKVEQDDTLKEN